MDMFLKFGSFHSILVIFVSDVVQVILKFNFAYTAITVMFGRTSHHLIYFINYDLLALFYNLIHFLLKRFSKKLIMLKELGLVGA
jgi:hypothetical protein